MKKELLILSFVVVCAATGCLGHVASDAGYDGESSVVLTCESDYDELLAEIEELQSQLNDPTLAQCLPHVNRCLNDLYDSNIELQAYRDGFLPVTADNASIEGLE